MNYWQALCLRMTLVDALTLALLVVWVLHRLSWTIRSKRYKRELFDYLDSLDDKHGKHIKRR